MKLPSFLESKPCAICGSGEYRVKYSWPKKFYNREKYETCSWDGRQDIPLQIVSCTSCGFIYTNPSFKEKNLELIYPGDIIDKTLSPENLFNPKNKKFNSILKIAKQYKKSGVLMDIGTRFGALPKIATDRYGYQGYGIEYNPASVEYGKKYFSNIYEGTITTLLGLTKKLKRPEIIVMDDVLEHLVYPNRDFDIIQTIQTKGDIIIMRQMDYNSLGRKLFGKSW